MKAMRDVEGLPVICVREGIECGRVRKLLIDPREGKVRYLIIEDEEWYLGAKLLPFDKLLGIGPHAVITESRENILPFSQVKEAHAFVKQGMNLTGARVYTQKGRHIGNVKEYYFDEGDGRLIRCRLQAQNQKELELDASRVVTYGNGILVAGDSADEADDNEGHGVNGEANQPAERTGDEQGKHQGSSLFEQKQRRFLLGKRVTKRIMSEEGELLADQGDIVTDELVDKVKAGGKLVELTMNIEAV